MINSYDVRVDALIMLRRFEMQELPVDILAKIGYQLDANNRIAWYESAKMFHCVHYEYKQHVLFMKAPDYRIKLEHLNVIMKCIKKIKPHCEKVYIEFQDIEGCADTSIFTHLKCAFEVIPSIVITIRDCSYHVASAIWSNVPTGTPVQLIAKSILHFPALPLDVSFFHINIAITKDNVRILFQKNIAECDDVCVCIGSNMANCALDFSAIDTTKNRKLRLMVIALKSFTFDIFDAHKLTDYVEYETVSFLNNRPEMPFERVLRRSPNEFHPDRSRLKHVHFNVSNTNYLLDMVKRMPQHVIYDVIPTDVCVLRQINNMRNYGAKQFRYVCNSMDIYLCMRMCKLIGSHYDFDVIFTGDFNIDNDEAARYDTPQAIYDAMRDGPNTLWFPVLELLTRRKE